MEEIDLQEDFDESQALNFDRQENEEKENPLDPDLDPKTVFSYFYIVQKHMLQVNHYIVFAIIITSILLTNFALLAETRDDVILLGQINQFKYRWYFLWFKVALNIAMLLHFVWCYYQRDTALSRATMIDSDVYNVGFQALGIIVYFKKYLVFPMHIVVFLRMLSCQDQDTQDKTNMFCQNGISVGEAFLLALFFLNVLTSCWMYYFIQTYSVSMIDIRKDPLACTDFEAIDIFTFMLTLNYIFEIVPESVVSSYTLDRMHSITIILILISYQLRYRKKQAYFNFITSTIYEVGKGYLFMAALEKLQVVLSGGDLDSNQGLELSRVFKLLLYSLILRFCYNLVIQQVDHQYHSIDLDSKVWQVTHAKNIFNTLKYFEEVSYQDGMSEGEIKSYVSSEQLVRILGMFEMHKSKCTNVNCPCQDEKNTSYGKHYLRRFRDLYSIKLKAYVQANPSDHYMALYYILFLIKYDRNIQNMLLVYTKLKQSETSSFLHGQIWRVGVMLEKILDGCYQGTRKLDGYKETEVVAKEFQDVTNKQALDAVFKKSKTNDNIRVLEFLKLDRAIEIMLSKIRDSINQHHIFLDLVHSRDTTIESLHQKNVHIQKLHKNIDNLYRKVEDLSFRFSSSHLLPYALFKNYTQNEIQLCNQLIKEYKQKWTSQERILDRHSHGILNSSIEHESICMLLSLTEESFCDIRYVTQSYRRVLGSDISLDEANLKDIMIPEIAELHQNMIQAYFWKMETSYFGIHKQGLISLKEKLLEKVHYVVTMFPSLLTEPMMMLYIKKAAEISDERDQFLLAFNKQGKIVGGDYNTIHLYPQFFNLSTEINDNIFCLNQQLRGAVTSFMNWETYKKSSRVNSSVNPENIKKSQVI